MSSAEGEFRSSKPARVAAARTNRLALVSQANRFLTPVSRRFRKNAVTPGRNSLNAVNESCQESASQEASSYGLCLTVFV
jgi:hypothetical protein